MNAIQIARARAVFGTPETTVLEAAVRMTEQRTGAMLIRDSQQRLLGIFTERDNLQRVTAGGRDPGSTTLAQVMTKAIHTARPDTSVETALGIMITHHIRHLPIVHNNQEVLGIVSLQHALIRQVRDEQAAVQTLADYVSAGGPG